MVSRTVCNTGVLALALAVAACEDDMESMLDASADGGEQEAGAGGDAAAARPVELSFEARVGDAVFDCAQTYDAIGSSNIRVEMLDFRFYIHGVHLVDDAGREVPVALTQDGAFQYEDVALLDFEDRTGSCSNGTSDTNALVKGTVPEGNYKAVRFAVGVPEALNHTDHANTPAPLNLTAMVWTWQAGRLFTRLDARVATESGARPSFLIHLGSDQCSGNPAAGDSVTCNYPNRAEVELADFDPERDKIVLDYAKLVADVALDQDQGGDPGCMSDASDPECVSIVGKLGLDPQTGAPGASAQSVFSIEPK